MADTSRVVKSQYNLIYSLINNIIVTILGFVTRTVFVHSLGVEYLGLNGLFTNILSILSLAELGVGSAITYSLYKPIAENDQKKIKALMGLYKSAYQKIGWIILAIGLIIIPFLNHIVNFDMGIEINYYIIYLMFLVNTVVSYWFFSYRSVIIYANQEGYILTKIETFFALVKAILQFVILIAFKNYYLYLFIPIVAGIIKNIVISIIAGKKYPIINEKIKEPLEDNEKKDIFKNVYALSLFKISGVIYGATDNIIISTWLGVKIVGVLSNYTMIIQLVSTYVNMFFQSMYASVGNLNAIESKEYKYITFNRLQLLNYWIYSYCAVCLGCFLNPCVEVWLGRDFCLDESTVLLLMFVFYIPGLNNIINIYKDACGLFKEVQWRALGTAIINLVVSVWLVIKIGIDGVFIGTIVAYLTTIYLVDPQVVFKKIFSLSVKKYYQNLIAGVAVFGALLCICKVIVEFVTINNWWSLIIWFLMLTLLINLVLVLIFRRTQEYVYLKQIVAKLFGRIKGKRLF